VLLRIQVSLVYFSSGLSKLIDPDWASGIVLWDRAVRYQNDIHPAPGWFIDLVTWRPLFWVVAPVAIATELFLAAGLWLPRTRLMAIRVAIVFHLAIELSAQVEVFSLAAIAALIIWVTPTPPDRTVRVRGATSATRVLAMVLPKLDWLGRFTVEAARPGDPDVTVVDRDGTTLHGPAALRLILERLPVTFPFAPLVRPSSR
jgi:Vitamin K-dependent gamma-carboxylase